MAASNGRAVDSTPAPTGRGSPRVRARRESVDRVEPCIEALAAAHVDWIGAACQPVIASGSRSGLKLAGRARYRADRGDDGESVLRDGDDAYGIISGSKWAS